MSWASIAWHCFGTVLAVGVYVRMSSHAMPLSAVRSGRLRSSVWCVGRLSVLGVVVVGWVCCCGVVSCLMSSGVLGVMMMGMCGHVSAKQRGCHESP